MNADGYENVVDSHEKMRMICDERWAQMQYKNRFRRGLVRGLKVVLLTPVAVGMKVLSIASRIVGYVLAIGLPFGLWGAYNVGKQLYNGVALNELTHLFSTTAFFILPFIAMFISVVSASVSSYLFEGCI